MHIHVQMLFSFLQRIRFNRYGKITSQVITKLITEDMRQQDVNSNHITSDF